jgi:hypothetical protein
VKERHDLGSVEPLHASVFMVVQRFRGDLGLYVHLHALVTDGAFEEGAAALRFLPASPPTPERMTAVLAHVHKVLAAVDEDDLDMDPALRACVQLALASRTWVPPPEPAAPPPLTVSALGMHLHAATTVDGGSVPRGPAAVIEKSWPGQGANSRRCDALGNYQARHETPDPQASSLWWIERALGGKVAHAASHVALCVCMTVQSTLQTCSLVQSSGLLSRSTPSL